MASTTQVGGTCRTFIATGTAIDPFKLVKVDTNGEVLVATASSSEVRVGFTTEPVEADGSASVQLLNAGGTAIAEISDTIAIGDPLYGDAGGDLETTTQTGAIIAYALQAGVSGDQIEVLIA